MTNAKDEFLEFVADKPKVVCAVLEKDVRWKAVHLATLYENYSDKEWAEFLETIAEYNYNDGFGSQNLYGTIWFEDGTYADRGEYDGSEWWEYRKPPTKPQSGSKGGDNETK